MRTTKFVLRVGTSGLLAAFMLGAGLSAQDNLHMDPNLNPAMAPAPRIVTGSPVDYQSGPMDLKAAWGTSQQGVNYIAADQFTTSLATDAPNLEYAGNFFFNTGSGTTDSVRYYAQLDVEPGLLISHLSCHFIDNDPTANVGFTWFKYITDFGGGGHTPNTIDSFVTSGTPGLGFGILTGNETMHVYDPVNDHLINHHIAVDVTGQTSFAGCYAFWTRQVAPGPGTATFNDVPTGHAFFQHVEALAASGITAGCGGGNYCPNQAVTRGQMAVFLAAALGLGFPY